MKKNRIAQKKEGQRQADRETETERERRRDRETERETEGERTTKLSHYLDVHPEVCTSYKGII